MKDFILTGTGLALIICFALIAPMIFLWSTNTLFEQASIDAYIPHTVWSYIASFGILACLRGGK